jgi:hypothetical protein
MLAVKAALELNFREGGKQLKGHFDAYQLDFSPSKRKLRILRE